ncbi:DUF2956 family protein [Salinivibrio sp. MA427]|uniref:DUF2956 family protein n=1 Tax=Salinivibrio sp. MA427 TaxID=1909455 RepID=UPI001F5BEDCE|nr:DUF2956 family protein [Salinivibrio sp. MA427]
MAKAKANATISPETQQDAMRVAKATQKPGQTKAQTKLIAKGLKKGLPNIKRNKKQKHASRIKHEKNNKINHQAPRL